MLLAPGDTDARVKVVELGCTECDRLVRVLDLLGNATFVQPLFKPLDLVLGHLKLLLSIMS